LGVGDYNGFDLGHCLLHQCIKAWTSVAKVLKTQKWAQVDIVLLWRSLMSETFSWLQVLLGALIHFFTPLKRVLSSVVVSPLLLTLGTYQG
jgi:hypothetical protein